MRHTLDLNLELNLWIILNQVRILGTLGLKRMIYKWPPIFYFQAGKEKI